MKKRIILLSLFLVLPSFSSAQKAILIEEGIEEELSSLKKKVKKESKTDTKWWPPLSSQKSTASYQDFSDALELRSKKRIGAGVSLSGQLGVLGFMAELNISSRNAAVIGFGTGFNYSTMTGYWKHVFGGGSIAPYTTLGLAKWMDNGSRSTISSTTPNFFADRFLNSSEKASGKFSKDLFIPSIGLQYYTLSGSRTGTSFFAELVLITNLSNLESIPTGSFGSIYYF